MTPEKWQHIKELFDSALERRAEDRAAFLDRACDGDESLRKEVESLLASFDKGESFMERPAVALAAETLAGSQGESLVGQTIGHYQVTREIGSGGMGEVYLAQDTRLGRHVALKLLASYLSKDEDRLRRFEREARTASALNHPNVCVIHEVGETEDKRHYMAMEYVDGVTLRQHMMTTQTGLSEVLEVAVQIASGLAAAHEVGIVHRDIKPENIMLRRDGYVKVLDFGIAKLTEATATDSEAATKALVKTDTGVVMGTGTYMSPEQARGLAVDARTDIWSLGVVLYEMVTGRAPFEGATTSDVLVSILDREPAPLAQYSPEAPAELQRIVTKALRKEREERYQTIKDLLPDLKSLKQELELRAKLEQSLQPGDRGTIATDGPAIRPQLWWRSSRLIGLTLVLALVIGGTLWVYFSRPTFKNFTLSGSESSLPPMRTTPFTSLPGYEGDLKFSPDGKQIAFVWGGENNENPDIYVKLVDAGAPLRLTTHPGRDGSPTWSPDGRYIAFTRLYKGESGIFMVAALGGSERRLIPLSFTSDWYGELPAVDWAPDGKFLAFTDRDSPQEAPGIFLLSVETLERRRLTSPPAQYRNDWFPAFSPDGKTLAFARWISDGIGDIYLVSSTGGEPRRLTFDNTWINGLTWTANGSGIVFNSFRSPSLSLWRISVSGGAPERLAVGGEHGLLAGTGISRPAISRQGHRLAYSLSSDDVNLWRVEVPNSPGDAGVPTKVISSTRIDIDPHISPDGSRIAFSSDRAGGQEIWVCEADGSNPVQLTNLHVPWTGTPRWSPDGRQIAFDSRAEGFAQIYVINAEGGPPRRITNVAANNVVPSWSRDRQWIYFASNRSGWWQLWKTPAEGGEAVQVTKNGGFLTSASPDGRWIYYSKIDASGLWRIPVEGGEESLLFDQPRLGYWGYWAVADKGIYFVDPEAKPRPTIELFDLATRRVKRIATIEKDVLKITPGFAVSADGQWVLYCQMDQSGSDIMLVENFQ